MSATVAWDRLGLWRLTRNRFAKRLHAALEDVGVYAAQLDRFVADAAAIDARPATDAIDEVRVRRAIEGVPASISDDPVAPADRVLTAVSDGDAVGHCVLSDRPVYVPELDRRLVLSGAYLWRVHVDPAERNQGIGKTLIGAALGVARSELDGTAVTALVAPDNVPSRRAFAALGFTPRERLTTVKLGNREWSWTSRDS